jgi:hypothetical protein
MDNFYCDSPPDEDGEENPLPAPREWSDGDCLEPVPPPYWIKVIAYPRYPYFLAVGCWILVVAKLQEAAATLGPTLGQQIPHRWLMVCRLPDGTRVLVVHPDLGNEAREWIETCNGALRHCNCGGYDCLDIDGHLATKAMRVFAARAWPKLAMAARIELLIEGEAETISMAADDTPDFGEIDNAFLLDSIVNEAG